MKYMITMTDEQVKHFKLDGNGKTIVLTDVHGVTKAFPIESDKFINCFLCGTPKTMLFCPWLQSLTRGKWINLNKDYKFLKKHIVKCSLCNNSLDLRAVNGGRGDANYCPNCGAKMESEEK